MSDLYMDQKDSWGKGLPGHLNYSAPLSTFGKEVYQTRISWCATDQSYEKIRHVVLNKNLFIFPADLTKREDMENLSRFLSERGKTVDSVYTSNCHEYTSMEGEQLDNLAGSVDILAHETEAYVVTTQARKTVNSGPEARPQNDPAQTCLAYSSKEALLAVWKAHGEETFHFPMNNS